MLWVLTRNPSPPIRAEQPDEFSALRGLAERTARQVLPEAGVTRQKVELTVPKARIEDETSRVKTLAAGFGGSAIASPLGDGGADLLVQLPVERSAAFLAAVAGPAEPRLPMPASTSADKVFVEVILEDVPAPAL
ncbi:MAG: hypothetical protein JO015_18335 [Verrucomicrobia bacterium]|nr:hypothetical protein [Verrucomicrobiota bacterium]